MPAAQAVMEEVMALLCEHLPGLKLPNIHGNKKSPVGQICYHLGDMMFQTFNVPPTGIEFLTEPLEGGNGKPSADPNGIITLVRQTIIIKDIEVSTSHNTVFFSPHPNTLSFLSHEKVAICMILLRLQ